MQSSALNTKNKIFSIRRLAVPVTKYSFWLVKWTEQAIRIMDRKNRKLLTTRNVVHPRADVLHWLYVLLKEGGRDLRKIEAS